MCKQAIECCDVFLGNITSGTGAVFDHNISLDGRHMNGSGPPLVQCQRKTKGPMNYCDDVLKNKKMPKTDKPLRNPLNLPTCEVKTTEKYRICEQCKSEWQKIEQADPRYLLAERTQGSPKLYNHWTARQLLGQEMPKPPQTQAMPKLGLRGTPQQCINPENDYPPQPLGETTQGCKKPSEDQAMKSMDQYPSPIIPSVTPFPNGCDSTNFMPEMPKQQLPQQFPTPRPAVPNISTQNMAMSPNTSRQCNTPAGYQAGHGSQLLTPGRRPAPRRLAQQISPPYMIEPPIHHASQPGMPVLTNGRHPQPFPQQVNAFQRGPPVSLSQMPTPPTGMHSLPAMHSNASQHQQPSQAAWSMNGANGTLNGIPHQPFPYQPQMMMTGMPNGSQQMWQNGNGHNSPQLMTPLQPVMAPSSNLGYRPSPIALPSGLLFPKEQQSTTGVPPRDSLKRKARDSLEGCPLTKKGIIMRQGK